MIIRTTINESRGFRRRVIEVMLIKSKVGQISLHRGFTKSVFLSIEEGREGREGDGAHIHRRVLHSGAMALVTTNFAQNTHVRNSRGGAVARIRAGVAKPGVGLMGIAV